MILATLSACSAEGPVTGTVDGGVFVAKDAIFLPASAGQDLGIEIADYAGACAVPYNKANSHVLGVSFNTSVTPAASGTYPIPSDGVSAMLVTSDAQCGTKADFATGTLTITSASASAISGNIDVSVSGGSLRGTFTAPACLFDAGAPSCTP